MRNSQLFEKLTSSSWWTRNFVVILYPGWKSPKFQGTYTTIAIINIYTTLRHSCLERFRSLTKSNFIHVSVTENMFLLLSFCFCGVFLWSSMSYQENHFLTLIHVRHQFDITSICTFPIPLFSSQRDGKEGIFLATISSSPPFW